MKMFLDIEALPTDDPAVIADIAARIKPPSNYKKAETIAEWERDVKPDLVRDAVSKTALDGLYGRVCCIGAAVEDADPVAIFGDLLDESVILKTFFDACHCDEFVGHNIHGFDLPFLKHRAMIHGIKPPDNLLRAMNAKPWDNCIHDTMLMWSTDREKRVCLDRLCKAFGIEGKGDMDGSKVAETWKTDPDKVAEYCRGDVHRTRAVYNRLTFNVKN